MHTPVLLKEVMAMSRSPETDVENIWDGTFGRGGHTAEFLRLYPSAKVWATDRDPQALASGEKNFADEMASGRLKLSRLNFHEVPEIKDNFDVILLDLGVSSPQLDEPSRGFSFYHDGPLDMRMDPDRGSTAADIVNTYTEDGLFRVFSELGEISRPGRVVRAIVDRRKQKAFSTTAELSGLIESTEGWRKKGHHPATNYFLALRLLVNEELDGLQACLPLILDKVLRPGGRILVITFHSLEDRIVKYIFKAREDGRMVNKKVIVPSREEILANPRSRSAKLRVFERGNSEVTLERS